jgi:DnaJ like chaperone protein
MWGKIIGGGIGALVGGPLGAVGGAAVGHWFDSDSDEEIQNHEHETTLALFICIFSSLAKMAKADGRICKNEIAHIEGLIKEHFEFDEEQRKGAIQIFREAKDCDASLEDFVIQYVELVGNNEGAKVSFFAMLYHLSMADGEMHQTEESLLKECCEWLGFTEVLFYEMHKEAGNDLSTCYELIGCSPQASDKDVKKAYREKSKKFHPDTLAASGLDEEFTQFASQKFNEITEAYDRIMASRAS